MNLIFINLAQRFAGLRVCRRKKYFTVRLRKTKIENKTICEKENLHDANPLLAAVFLSALVRQCEIVQWKKVRKNNICFAKRCQEMQNCL